MLLVHSQRLAAATCTLTSHPAGSSLLNWRATPAPIRRGFVNNVEWAKNTGSEPAYGSLLPAGVSTLLRRRAKKPVRWSARAIHAAANTTYLHELRIRDFALVQDQRVHFHPGLNIITGQSGSGKSVLLEAISQLCGAPAREEGIRTGAKCAVLQATFQVGDDKLSAVRSILERYGASEVAVHGDNVSTETERCNGNMKVVGESVGFKTVDISVTTKLVIERRLVYVEQERSTSKLENEESSEGISTRRVRSFCRVNDTNMPVKALRALGQLLIDFNGQGAAAALSDEDTQMELLDDWAGTHDHRRKFDEFATVLAKRRAEAAKNVNLTEDEVLELEHLIDAINAVEPVEREDAMLKAELRRMEASRVAAEACSGVLGIFGGNGDVRGGLCRSLNDAAFQIKGLAGSAQRAAKQNIKTTDVGFGDEKIEDSGGSVDMENAVFKYCDDDARRITAAVEGLEEAVSMCQEAEALAVAAQTRVTEYAASLRVDSFRREECTMRLRELDRLCRDIGVKTATQACAAREQMVANARLQAANEYRERRKSVMEDIASAEHAVAEAGLALATARRVAAGQLRHDVTTALSSLAMDGSRFDVSLVWERIRSRSAPAQDINGSSPIESPSSSPLQIPSVFVDNASEIGEQGGAHFRVHEGGLDRVSFLLAAGPNEPLRSMGAIASGGEKARLMLAFKLAPAFRAETLGASEANSWCNDEKEPSFHSVQKTAAFNSTSVSVFDELDSGVGARIGAHIGIALRRLASKGGQQVLCVTHLPQVAAHGDSHLRISKVISRDTLGEFEAFAESESQEPDLSMRTTIKIELLANEEARIDEISAMLGLGEVEGRESATRLLMDSRATSPSSE